MSYSENLTYQWTLLCFLGLFNEYMLVWSRDAGEYNALRSQYISRIWSDWAPWSVCSRTCGGGVRQRNRTCRARMVGYRAAGIACVGDTVEYELCARHACSPSEKEFLDYQCSRRNGQIIAGKRIDEWIPYRYGRNPCELQCRAKDRSLMYSFGKVVDGTPCPASNPKDPALCVNGRCTPVDCAGYLGTDNRRDQCGVCRGENSTCVKYQNTFWRRPRNALSTDGRKEEIGEDEEWLVVDGFALDGTVVNDVPKLMAIDGMERSTTTSFSWRGSLVNDRQKTPRSFTIDDMSSYVCSHYDIT
ncbi:ADAMTS-like protein 5 [Araneus ventricosus]|uniref:ADAMTS-like protein 5 n=1 Tax=Araneus ventricosus TaxID=182803 RepID=A0A4Y2TKQ5_ARAVE|nr:ADAMTS-like protein 5 [Araneus ventricosus]